MKSKGFTLHHFMNCFLKNKKNKHKEKNKTKKNGEGFTLIETLVSVAMIVLILGLVSSFILMAYKTHGYSREQSLAIDEARRGMEKMTKDLREARPGEDGSYVLEKAGDKEIVFYSDIDGDNQTEKVRYFLGTASSGSETKYCVTYTSGGSCNVVFSNFLKGTLKTAQAKISVEGDFGSSNEYAAIYADGSSLISNICRYNCIDCAASWQGTATFDVFNKAGDDSVQFLADANSNVSPICYWENPAHSMKAKFEFSWTEEITGAEHELKLGITEPTAPPVQYLAGDEKITVLSSYVRNAPPIFEYFDENGNLIADPQDRLKDTKIIKVFLVVNVDPNRPPTEFQLESYIQPRNLKEE